MGSKGSMSGFPPSNYAISPEYKSLMEEPRETVNEPKEIPSTYTPAEFKSICQILAGIIGTAASLLAILEYIRVHF